MAMTYKLWLSRSRRQFLIDTLVEAKGNQLAAAEALGVHRNTLFRMLHEDGIGPEVVRAIRRNQATNHTAVKTTIPYPTQSIYRTTT
jgi:hypothetical protein